MEDIPVLKEYADVFLEEIPRLPPKRELDFTIGLVLGAVPSSKAPYRMNILELNELKSQLKELIHYIPQIYHSFLKDLTLSSSLSECVFTLGVRFLLFKLALY